MITYTYQLKKKEICIIYSIEKENDSSGIPVSSKQEGVNFSD
jgi:hypothetical protein